MLKLLYVTLCTLLIFGFLSANAEQFIPYTTTIQSSKPIICVLDNSAGSDSMNMTRVAINAWSEKLNHLTHSHNWDMTVQLVDRVHFTDCNISFDYTLAASDPISIIGHNGKATSGRILGITNCDQTLYGHVFCEIDINLLNNTPNTILTTVEHEFGHALGIGHRQGDTKGDSTRAFLSDDLMFAMAKTFSHLTNEDALAIIHLYGAHGFSEPKIIPDRYTINYPVHLKVYCNGISGKICFSTV